MATLTISVTSAIGTNQDVLNFSGTDANRILTAYQNVIKPGGTQADLVDWIASSAKGALSRLVIQSETTVPTSPTFS